jgi:hypothetical protein
MLIARVISLSIFSKQIFNTGYGCTPKEFIVIIWSGIRGAVGLSFAMLAHED